MVCIFWIVVAFILFYLYMSVSALVRLSMPLEPALTPGSLTDARDPGYFDGQEKSFAADGFETGGDFTWHEGMATISMRVFREKSGEAYGWAVEEALAGSNRARHTVSVLTEFADGTLLDTTTGASSLNIPPWFPRETVPGGDTGRLLARHRERRAALAGEGKVIFPAGAGDGLLETIRRNEHRLSMYQVESGKMRLIGGKLRFTPASVARLFLRGLRPFGRGK